MTANACAAPAHQTPAHVTGRETPAPAGRRPRPVGRRTLLRRTAGGVGRPPPYSSCSPGGGSGRSHNRLRHGRRSRTARPSPSSQTRMAPETGVASTSAPW